MPELLLELLSEEIPARMQARAADDLKRIAGDALKGAGLAFESIQTYATPRRLVLVVGGLPKKQADVAEEKRGPRVDAPEQAVQGFLRANGVTLKECEKRATEKGEFWFVVIKKKGRATANVISEIVPAWIGAIPWPKSMRWGAYSSLSILNSAGQPIEFKNDKGGNLSLENETRWVRPIRRILCLFESRVVAFKFAEVKSSNMTVGHRFLAPKPFAVKDFADYRKKLLKAKVVLDAAERRAIIERDAITLAGRHGLRFAMDDGLMHEVSGLVEWPVVLCGSIDKAFMELPPEVLTVSMRQHQKYFRLDDADGNIAPRFVVVANMETVDGGKAVVAGNERVLRARLSDARFFWDQDRKKKLESRVSALKDRTFHAKLGTDFDRVERIRRLATGLIGQCVSNSFRIGTNSGSLLTSITRAAFLCKADLTAGMVGEFPELQGVMGNYYAINDGESLDVAMAIADHYSPVGPNDSCPSAPVSVAVALADKIDTLVGFFAINEKPTGSKDPFALRRAALGVIRLIVENKLRLKLEKVFFESDAINRTVSKGTIPAADVPSLLAFFADRLKVTLKDKGVRHDLIDAVFALGGEDDLVRLLARVDALAGFLKSDDGANLLVAYRRAANILRIEEKKDGMAYDGAVDRGMLREAEEAALFEKLVQSEQSIATALSKEQFQGAMLMLAELRLPVDRFFDKVTVNATDVGLRGNRLRLLSRIRSALGGVADFSRIEG